MRFKDLGFEDEDLHYPEDVGEFVLTEIWEHTRWNVIHRYVFKHTDGKLYEFFHTCGATEYQDNEELTSEDEVYEVTPIQKTVTVYERVK